MRTFRQFLLITWGHWRRWDHSDDLKCSVSYRGYQCANSVHRMVVPKLNFCCYTQIGVATQFIEPSTLICPQAASTQYAFCWRENHVKMFHANCIISTWDSETRLTSPAETSYELTFRHCSSVPNQRLATIFLLRRCPVEKFSMSWNVRLFPFTNFFKW